jgi:hypothetical protein
MKQVGIGRDIQLLGGLFLIVGTVNLVWERTLFIDEPTSENRPKSVPKDFL